MALLRPQSHIETQSSDEFVEGVVAEAFAIAVVSLVAVTVWLLIKHAVAQRRVQRQAQIATSGASSRGAIAAIQRPFMLDACTRVYFDFKPEGSSQLMRACHIVQGPEEAFRKSLPPIGAVVTVRYQPDRPHEAVLLSLAPRSNVQELARV